MHQQFLEQQNPRIELFDEETNEVSSIAGVDILEITADTSALIAKHTGEDGTVFADTRVRRPAQYRIILTFPATDDPITDAHKNLLNSSFTPASKFQVTGYFTMCTNMMVSSSRHRDTPEMQGLRVQEVVLDECLDYATDYGVRDLPLSVVDNPEHSDSCRSSSQFIA